MSTEKGNEGRLLKLPPSTHTDKLIHIFCPLGQLIKAAGSRKRVSIKPVLSWTCSSNPASPLRWKRKRSHTITLRPGIFAIHSWSMPCPHLSLWMNGFPGYHVCSWMVWGADSTWNSLSHLVPRRLVRKAFNTVNLGLFFNCTMISLPQRARLWFVRLCYLFFFTPGNIC